jgi:hypothetical protein
VLNSALLKRNYYLYIMFMFYKCSGNTVNFGKIVKYCNVVLTLKIISISVAEMHHIDAAFRRYFS